MAVRFDNSGDRLLRTTDLPDYNAPHTWMAWVYLVSDLNAASTLITLNDDSTSNVDILRTTGDGVTLDLRVVNGGDASTVTGTALVVGIWAHIALVRESVTSCKLYLNDALDITNPGDVTDRTAATRMEHGAFRSTNTQRSDSRVMAIKA